MKIAHVAPLHYSVPPRQYGGSERLIACLVDELVTQRHHVTLFASGDSKITAQLAAPIPRAVAYLKKPIDEIAAHLVMLDEVARRAAEYDVIHFHIDALHFPLLRRLSTPSLTTLYWHQNVPEQDALYRHFADLPFVALSNHQRHPRPWLNWRATIYHGLHPSAFPFRRRHGDYLVFIGRITPEKGVADAVQIARRANLPLVIAGPISDHGYFNRAVRPHLYNRKVRYVGVVTERAKKALLSRSRALLFPSDSSEAYGVILIEALACGTPVITYAHGPMPEIIQDGVTGFLVNSVSDAATAVAAIPSLNREACRRDVETRFSVERTATDYLGVYSDVISSRARQRQSGAPTLPMPGRGR